MKHSVMQAGWHKQYFTLMKSFWLLTRKKKNTESFLISLSFLLFISDICLCYWVTSLTTEPRASCPRCWASCPTALKSWPRQAWLQSASSWGWESGDSKIQTISLQSRWTEPRWRITSFGFRFSTHTTHAWSPLSPATAAPSQSQSEGKRACSLDKN